MLEKDIECRPRVRIAADFEERDEQVPEKLLEVLHQVILFVHITSQEEHQTLNRRRCDQLINAQSALQERFTQRLESNLLVYSRIRRRMKYEYLRYEDAECRKMQRECNSSVINSSPSFHPSSVD